MKNGSFDVRRVANQIPAYMKECYILKTRGQESTLPDFGITFDDDKCIVSGCNATTAGFTSD